MTPTQRAAAQQAERAAFEAWVAKVQPAYWRVEAWQTEAWSMWQSISAALAEQPAPPPECQTEAEKTAYAFGWFKAMEAVREKKVEHPAEQEPEGAVCGRCGGLVFDPVIPQSAKPAEQRSDGMPNSSNERHLRRLLAVRVGMPNAYYDDGEAHGVEHGIAIDFMREPAADIDAKLRALNVARAVMAEQPAEQENVRDAETELNCAEEVLDGYAAHLDLEETAFDCIGDYIRAVCEALKTSAPQPKAEPQGEPVAWMWEVLKESPIMKRKGEKRGVYFENPADIGIDIYSAEQVKNYRWTPLCTAPQPAKQPLTDEEIDALWAKQQTKPFKTHSEDRMAFASAVIAAYERKNGIGEAK